MVPAAGGWKRGQGSPFPRLSRFEGTEVEPDTNLQSLQRLYGLTATEAAFVAAFVEETSLKGAAERLSLTMSSARTYLKRIFAKTEVNSQAALMKLVLTASPMPNRR